ncbi:MAG: class I SAM-dependent DNA methyltransferase [Acidobacteriaceae bacterium]
MEAPRRTQHEDAMGFVERWKRSEAAERANYVLFLSELCDFLALPRPQPTQAEEHQNSYVFEKTVDFKNLDGSVAHGRIDLYRRAHFVLEAKQGSNAPAFSTGSERTPSHQTSVTPRASRLRKGTAVRGTHGWDEAMLAARGQAEQYAKALPASEGWPPFLITVDVGHSIELFADFSLTGKAYLPFPDPRSYRILLDQLCVPEIQDRLRAVWLDPHSLDPSRHTARVTREVAAKLATLARTLELQHPAKEVAEFLTRCIFTSFGEDVRLLPEKSWLRLLESLRDADNVAVFPEMASSLWQTMNTGGFSPILREQVLQFNGGLFESTHALPLSSDQLNLLIEAADSNWRDVEPAIFGTLLERALDPAERHSLGAHYTPRAYVERLVIPTLVEPLRADWAITQAAIAELVRSDDAEGAIETARAFHRQLCNTRVLDPACGSGNFLYVALEHMKRLEGEVLETIVSLGETQQALEHTGLTVDPHQLLGIEINPRAAVVADLVLWIGYLQWHFRTRGDAQPPIPVIRNFHNIEHRDALMTWTARTPKLDKDGDEITQWDGITKKINSTTGKEVPDEAARRAVYLYSNAKQAKWPEAEFIVGNPPFIGGKDIRQELGDGYIESLRKVYDEVPDSADFVMYWWQRAAELARAGKLRRFGFITTNSLPQVFNRKVVEQNLAATKHPLSLIFAIPDHPWVKSLSSEERTTAKAAAVRIAMTVAERGEHEGHLYRVSSEGDTNSEGTAVELTEQTGKIFADLRVGADVTAALPLQSNEDLSCPGVKLHGAGFIVTPEQAAVLGLGRIPGLEQHIRPYLNGRDLTGTSRNVMVIDLFGLSSEDVRLRFPEVYQWLLDRVKPEREGKLNQTSDSQQYADKWWLFGKVRAELRSALTGLPRYISTGETSKHRTFSFLDAVTLPDNMLVNIASSDAFHLGVLSSEIHVQWAFAAGGRMGVGNDPRYNKTRCFDPFPFPSCTEAQQQTIRDLAERLDAHRKRQQQLHPWLTLTEMYNVLEKLRSNSELTGEEKTIYDSGLIGILRELHDELDCAVFDAYGWPHHLLTEQILERVVALNAERRTEEASGLVRWLRPEYQGPNAVAITPQLAGLVEAEPTTVARRKQPWPAALPDQVRAVKDSLRAIPQQNPAQIAAAFRPASRTRIQEILETLTSLGQTRHSEGRYSL